jgi:ElaB/YqjD/DUF883 family membrane-anchored ribosome-binding protein
MTTTQEAERLLNDLRTVVRDTESLLKTGGHELNEKARASLKETLETARVSCDRAEKALRETATRADLLVKEHPYESLGLALAVGVLLGIILGRR